MHFHIARLVDKNLTLHIVAAASQGGCCNYCLEGITKHTQENTSFMALKTLMIKISNKFETERFCRYLSVPQVVEFECTEALTVHCVHRTVESEQLDSQLLKK